ncbi:LysR family transcriptional regulator [Oceanimonas baumannii]|uniref:LysR family transcriptional regulator n=1 Tax=Oceanimonas baumannii TaxID=129578 RepID=A0A235CM50_9GAMM|nr:LysR family transcriptional regulator [Oceanimonas baumannii]OYD25620.1 LysR family transcriptional regulator [Oceanimonas baumannii]TDW61166.1 LysR family transcriptional regulator [Oceanimonas baumannii]
MEAKWLHDFIALSEQGSFSRAAESRFVTQPAFSRRIRSLENWLGVALVCRNRYPLELTPAGEAFLEQARQLLAQIYGIRSQLRLSQQQTPGLSLITQPALAVTFFPAWLHRLRPALGEGLVRLNTGHYHEAMEQFVAGAVDFLLCFADAGDAEALQRPDVDRLQVGQDRLALVSVTCEQGKPRFQLDDNQPLPLLLYPKDAFLGALVQRECLPSLGERPWLPVCENALGEGLKAQLLQGEGVAFLPESLVRDELATGRVVVLEGARTLELNIDLCRLGEPRSELAERFWHQSRLQALAAHC